MATKTSIEWTDSNWNFITGCNRVSAGCDNCYAIETAHRFSGEGLQFEGLTVIRNGKRDWSGAFKFDERALLAPLGWKRPTKIFVTSMSDPFHHAVPDEWLDRMFAVMALTPQHTYQLLTKRPERMLKYFADLNLRQEMIGIEIESIGGIDRFNDEGNGHRFTLPLPNVWLGVSCEDQKTADERIPLLLQTPAAVRWVSAEPLLGPIDFDLPRCEQHDRKFIERDDYFVEFCGERHHDDGEELTYDHWLGDADRRIDWVVIGGESGSSARPFNVQWADDIIAQCQAANVAVFVKQMGSVPIMDEAEWHSEMDAYGFLRSLNASNDRKAPQNTVPLKFSKKGSDMSEWPEELRVREYPEVQA